MCSKEFHVCILAALANAEKIMLKRRENYSLSTCKEGLAWAQLHLATYLTIDWGKLHIMH